MDQITTTNPTQNQNSSGDFSKAYRKGFWRSILSMIKKTDNRLLPLDEVMQYLPLRGKHDLGTRQIEVDKIIGTVNRYHDFDRVFLPIQTNTRSRWESINTAFSQDVILPPIDVYKVGDVFFVRDGHHRVSVARERGQVFMDAYVVEIDVKGKIDVNTNIETLVLAHEYMEFLSASKLGKVIPEADFHFSIPGQYERLQQHISVHRWFLGEKLKRPVSREEAALSWYQEVYHPLIKIIRKHGILRQFPGRTETDLYLWIIEHRWYLAEETKKKISLETAATDFLNHFYNRPFRHIRQWIAWIKKRWFSPHR